MYNVRFRHLKCRTIIRFPELLQSVCLWCLPNGIFVVVVIVNMNDVAHKHIFIVYLK